MIWTSASRPPNNRFLWVSEWGAGFTLRLSLSLHLTRPLTLLLLIQKSPTQAREDEEENERVDDSSQHDSCSKQPCTAAGVKNLCSTGFFGAGVDCHMRGINMLDDWKNVPGGPKLDSFRVSLN